MAVDPENLERKKEVVKKVLALVNEIYGGSYKTAFDHYDSYDRNGKDGKISPAELMHLLFDAEIGNRLTRWTWAKSIIDTMDIDADGLISWEEFELQFTR